MDTIYIFEGLENNNYQEDLNLTLNKDTNINIFNKNLKNININILDNIEVTINDFNNLENTNTNIIFNINNNSSLTYNLSNIVDNNYNLKIDIKYNGNNSKVSTNIHSIVKGYEKISIIGNIENNYKDNELLENVKVILENDGKCEIDPDMLISTKEVSANHKVAISNIRDKELFYLLCKGLSKSSAEKLIKMSFIISNITDTEITNKINEIF